MLLSRMQYPLLNVSRCMQMMSHTYLSTPSTLLTPLYRTLTSSSNHHNNNNSSRNDKPFKSAKPYPSATASAGHILLNKPLPLESPSLPVNPIDDESSKLSTSNIPASSFSNAIVTSNVQQNVFTPVQSTDFVSTGIRDVSRGKLRQLTVSPRKLNDICRLVRGLSVHAALTHLALTPKKKAWLVAKLIRKAAINGRNNFNLNIDRLYVDKLWVGSGGHLKRLDIKGRGRHGMKYKYQSHIWVELKEQITNDKQYLGVWRYGGNSHDLRTGEEIRIGRLGPRLSTMNDQLNALKEWRISRGMSPIPGKSIAADAKKAFRASGIATDFDLVYGKQEKQSHVANTP